MFFFLCSVINLMLTIFFSYSFVRTFSLESNSIFFGLVCFICFMYCFTNFTKFFTVSMVSFFKYSNRKMYENLFKVGQEDEELKLGFYTRWPKPSDLPDNLLPEYIQALMEELRQAQNRRRSNGNGKHQ